MSFTSCPRSRSSRSQWWALPHVSIATRQRREEGLNVGPPQPDIHQLAPLRIDAVHLEKALA